MSKNTLPQHLTQIAADIFQLRLPLPFALNHVNCYLLAGDRGWNIFDTGLNTPAGREGWQAAFAALEIGPGDIEQIILTHVHPDHYGMAGWLQECCNAPVWMSPREAELSELVWKRSDLLGALPRMFGQAGVPPEIKEEIIAATGKTRQLTLPHPHTVKHLQPGATLTIGQRQLTALHAPGHSDGQLIFYDSADKVMLSGDQVLIKITPNIGLWPMTDPDPLGRYLTSLRELMALEVRLALPGHGPLINDWQGRLAELEQHHAKRLETMMANIDSAGLTPYQVSAYAFNLDRLSPHEVRFAVAETLAHLEYLVQQQHLRRRENGVLRYYRS
jgi:glyoxylase-like metal-dependent hydrolase (beta-lactamase superfamily II)